MWSSRDPAHNDRESTRAIDVGVSALLVVAATGLLLATLPGIDMGGDAAWKWAFVRSWGHDLPWVYDHHTARFSVNVPVYLTQQFLGTQVNVMYVAPLLFAAAQLALVYHCGRSLYSRAVGLGAALALLAFEPWAMASARLLPGVFQTTYLVAAVYCYSHVARSHQRRYLALLGLCLFLAYGAMISTVYFVPGFVLAVWWLRRRWTDNLLWLAVLGGCVLLETALYAAQSPYPLGQLQIIERTHTNVEPIAFWGLFGRYAALPRVWQIGLGIGALGTALLPWWTRSRQLHGLCMLIGTMLLAMTFGIKKLQPLVPALNFRARYFDPLAPLLALAAAACVHTAWRAWRTRRQSPVARRLSARAFMLIAGVAVLCEVGVVAARRGISGPAQLALNARQARDLSQAYLDGRPIVGRNALDQDQIKTLHVIAFAFFSEAAFWAQDNTRKPRLYRTKVGRHSHRFMARALPELKRVERAVASQRCVVFVARRSPEQGLNVQVTSSEACGADAAHASAQGVVVVSLLQ